METNRITIPIREVCLGLFDGPHATPKPSDSGPIFLGIRNVGESGQLDFSAIRHISDAEYPRWIKRVEPHAGDIVFSYEATLNRYAMIPPGFRGCLGRRMALIRPDESKVFGRFLFYYFFGREWREVIAQNTLIGSTVDRIPIAKFPDFPVTMPPLQTQRKVADILSAYDDLIENNLRRIKILEEVVQNLYRDWFVKFRFPGHQHARLVNSILGPIPKGWGVVPMESVCSRITDGAHRSPATTTTGYPMASVKDMHEWGVNIDTCRKIGEEDYRDLVRNDCKMRQGDVLIAKDGSYLKHCFVVEKDLDVALLSSIAMLRPNKRILPHILARTLLEPKTKERMKGYVSGVALPRIVLKEFRGFQIILPPISIQERWAVCVEPMINLCWRFIDKNANLRRTRDLLLPKLISGELDVSDLDIAVPESAS